MSKTVEERPYRPEDAMALRNDPNDKAALKFAGFEDWAKLVAKQGPGFTLVIDGKVIGCAGINVLWDGAGEAWGLFTSSVYDIRIPIFKHTRNGLHRLMEELKLRWIQTAIHTNFPRGINFIEHLGFKRKCLMEKYSPSGQDCYLYAMTG